MVGLTVDYPALAVTLGIGALGGVLAAALGVPLGYLLGSLLAVAITAAAGWRPLGRAVTMPMRLRMSFVPVIGVAIGGAFTPEVAQEALGWGRSLLALVLFVPLAHALGYMIFRRGGLPRVDAYFSALPGGLIESVQLGEEAGADVRLLTVLQFLRLILTIIAVPLIFAGVTGHAVGSAAGVQMHGADVALTFRDVLVLLACGGFGVWLARLCRIPAWIITGPLILSALAHALGWVEGVPPGWLISLTQVVLGTGLGARFAGVSGAMLRRAGGLAVLNGAGVMALAFGFAMALHALVGEPVAAVFLAFAPGGLAEMSLIALSLNISAIYVTTHHVLRIGMAVVAAQIGARWFAKG
ncbi:AbrB family transcriptional regulator [Pseudotabrizicola alkalilacus]|uniref:AbrB family transcriptional regulator n=1 Tax=Pseudotabrizicola alkalilacus TaxID=2305252 RepID=A0A411Z6S4_9RHOB|nr:AbrB family transcriptional regulator [Pseudotabrizicola alkalilacus]RGP38727.1 AbrB family transcriptional regulator [Pseudotabrizicola alkalilacus]